MVKAKDNIPGIYILKHFCMETNGTLWLLAYVCLRNALLTYLLTYLYHTEKTEQKQRQWCTNRALWLSLVWYGLTSHSTHFRSFRGRCVTESWDTVLHQQHAYHISVTITTHCTAVTGEQQPLMTATVHAQKLLLWSRHPSYFAPNVRSITRTATPMRPKQ